jgi:hypothetical protein
MAPWRLVGAPTQEYVGGRQDSLAVVGNLSKGRNPRTKNPGPPRYEILQQAGNLLRWRKELLILKEIENRKG